METKYIYGIIETSEETIITVSGIDKYEEVYAVPYKDISAAVSDSPFIDYTALPRDRVARYFLNHQRVIEKIMDFYTIIPMRLGTYSLSIGDVEEILSKGYTLFKDVFKKINNRIEIDVAATWNDLDPIIKEIGEYEDIKMFKENLMSQPEGVSVEDRIKIGSLIKNAMEKKREEISSDIANEFKKASVDLRPHDLMDDRMILNAAFLVDKGKRVEFENCLDRLNTLYNEKINFRCVGPLPPYSFYTAEIKKTDPEEITWAKEKLGIEKIAAKEDVVKAYRGKASLYHPDKNTDSANAERQFNEINKAYRILAECCHGNGSLVDEEAHIVVKIRD